MITSEIVIASINLLFFGLLLMLAGLRLRSKEIVVLHLALYIGFGLFSNLSRLMAALQITTLPEGSPNLFTELTLLAMILAFGALTLSFLKKKQKIVMSYWSGALIILLLWIALRH